MLRADHLLDPSSDGSNLIGIDIDSKFLLSLDERFPVTNIVCMPVEADTRLLGAVFGCFLASVSGRAFYVEFLRDFLNLLVPVAMIGMLYIQLRKYGNLNSALMKVFYQDGAFYFMCLSGERLNSNLRHPPY